MECVHANTRDYKATKTVAGLEYQYSTKQCAACDSVLWSPQNEANFHKWLGDQKKSKRDRFVLQKLLIPRELVEFAEKLAASRCTKVSNVYQAALACYFVYAPTRQGWKEALDDENFANHDEAETINKVEVNPNMFLTIEGNAKLFKMTNSAIASWAVSRVLQAALKGQQALERNEIEQDILAIVFTTLAA